MARVTPERPAGAGRFRGARVAGSEIGDSGIGYGAMRAGRSRSGRRTGRADQIEGEESRVGSDAAAKGKRERCGGEGGIRTHEERKPLPVFKTGAVNRLATSPHDGVGRLERISGRAYQATLELIKQIQKTDPKH